MKTLYITYFQNGKMKRGVISQEQYKRYCGDSTISNINIHATQQMMEESYKSYNGINNSNKQLIYG